MKLRQIMIGLTAIVVFALVSWLPMITGFTARINPCVNMMCPSGTMCVIHPCNRQFMPCRQQTECIDNNRWGECPVVQPGVPAVCVHSCRYDGQCPEGLKCCNNGCGYECTRPESPRQVQLFPDRCQSTWCAAANICMTRGDYATCMVAKKNGTCPLVTSYNVLHRNCRDRCIMDGECLANKICCSNGCANVCRQSMEDGKPGLCPQIPIGLFGVCLERCSSDMECADRMKCCPNGCGHVCVTPA